MGFRADQTRRTVHFGTFNAEAYLNDGEGLVQLPAIVDRDSEKLIHAMDELLFPLCTPENFLLTRYALQPMQKKYLESIGIRFQSNAESIDSSYSTGATLIALLTEQARREKYQPIFTKSVRLSPYAHIPEIVHLCSCFDFPDYNPAAAVVKKVNSKMYSHSMHEDMGIPQYGEQVTTLDELLTSVAKLSGRKFLLKHPLGVSGKGNLLIESKRMLERIMKYFQTQINEGKRLEILVEPFLDKMIDFSCQMKIGRDGRCELLSVQKMDNNSNFAYCGSSCADSGLNDLLEKKGYFSLMERVGAKLFADGYFGYACVDSMLLRDQTLVPIVEINARESMGLINYSLNEYLKKDSLKSHLRFFSVGIPATFSYEAMLSNLHKAELLYQAQGKPGVLPLASNAVSINRDADVNSSVKAKSYKGRVYFSAAAPDSETADGLSQRFRAFLGEMNLSTYN
jgi:hypothetical protein